MVLLRPVHSGEGVHDPGATYDEENARASGEVSVGAGGVGSGLFIAETDEPDPRRDESFGDFNDGDADDAKDDGDV